MEKPLRTTSNHPGIRRSGAALGFTFIELLVALAIVAILTAVAIPGLLSARRRAAYAQAVADTKTVVTQAVVYASDRGSYPGAAPIQTMRTLGYVAVRDTDPWGRPYEVTPGVLPTTQPPAVSDEVLVWSKGPTGAAPYVVPPPPTTGVNGCVGYSTVYGSFTGS